MHLLRALPLTLFGLWHASALAVQPGSPEVQLVVDLYKAFSWEALIESPAYAGRGFEELPRPTLERFLAPQLAASLVADNACKERTREVCKLNFKVLWASQDPDAHTLRVEQGKELNVVLVRYVYPSTNKEIQIKYDLVATSRGPRIKDIRYATGPSLAAILGQKP